MAHPNQPQKNLLGKQAHFSPVLGEIGREKKRKEKKGKRKGKRRSKKKK